MFAQHEKGISKTRRITGYVLSLLPALAVMGSGFTKFLPDNEIHALLEKLGMADYAVLIGIIEIGVVVLYAIPRTSNVGFFLFCSYVGAIIVGELVIGDVPLPGLTIGVMIYVGTLLRKPSLLGWDRGME
ncbi:hypothetical protein [Neolewinella antarctica]|uniref:DoxX family protein n=1 Tax=Neolewinella antarctica TaxID=442734 RepID=A0ABX0X709_9BACT|nr:hypothetical protein [Neolewinella antarctica]NJC24922.1 hypothetical protein [Neolewinella antarctica]